MKKTFIISDTHFNHANIIKYESRPFESTYEMDEKMIENWNKVVGMNDIVYHLGDFAFNMNKERITALLSRLNGRKRLVMGNHDFKINKHSSFFRECGFEEVYDNTIIIDEFFILSHKPVYMNKSMPYYNLHGHIHSNTMNADSYFNASVECIDYTPVLLLDIKKGCVKSKVKGVKHE